MHGCLAADRDELANSLRPLEVEFSYPIVDISVGSNHWLAVTESGELYACGCNEFGKKKVQNIKAFPLLGCLGLGDEESRCALTKVEPPTTGKIVKIFVKTF